MTAQPHVLLVPIGATDPAEAPLQSIDGIDCLLMFTTARRARHYADRLKRDGLIEEDLEPLALTPEQVAAVLGGLVGQAVRIGVDASVPYRRPKYVMRPAEVLGPLGHALRVGRPEAAAAEPAAEPQVEADDSDEV